jgi:HD-GYP domain-containing protein (c-di-GMP phosphodiesterase class II)
VERWRIVLSGISAPIEGQRWEAKQLLRIGRQEGLEIVLDDPSVSRKHSEIYKTADGWMIRDLGSTNGTTVNSVRLTDVAKRLEPNDLIQFGTLYLRIAVLEEASLASTKPAHPSRFLQKCDPPKRAKASGSFLKIQAHTRNTWEKALEMAAFAPDTQSSANKHLAVLLRTGYHLSNIACLEELLHSILTEVVTVLDAQRGAILLHDEISGQLLLRQVVVANRNLKTETRCYSRTLTERSFVQAESLLCQDTNAAADLQGTNSIKLGAMSSIICALLRTPRKQIGVLHLDRAGDQAAFTSDDLYLADAFAANMAVGIESARMVERERQQFIQTVTALARTVEVRDQYTINHSQRVTDYSLIIGEAMELSAGELQMLRIGTPLHDIGKIGIADAILRKPGRLTDEEFAEMKTHPAKGAAILEAIPALKPVLPIVRHHHERWDGQGYPDRLAGESISCLARIVAVADAFDAMTSNRPYRRALSIEVAYREMQLGKGTHFDPACAQAFLEQRFNVEAVLAREGLLQQPLPSVDFIERPIMQPLGV